MDMEHIPSTYETLYHARDNQPVILNQRTVRNNSGHQNQGCLCWNERSNGVASLCMGLLCVLLLACIIVQHFIYNSGHKQLESIQNLTLQRDNLLKGLSKVDETIQSDWWYYNSSVYYISKLNEKMKWTDSRQNCKVRGADLVIINSWAEQMDVWIGLTDRDNLGVLTWVDGFPLTIGFWGPNQPANWGVEVCVQQKNIKSTRSPWIAGKSWETSSCTSDFNFVCEKKIFQ